MSRRIETLAARLGERFNETLVRADSSCGELTCELAASDLRSACIALRDEFGFELLMDVCGVDYLDYGATEWTSYRATETGFSRGVARREVAWASRPLEHPVPMESPMPDDLPSHHDKPRFAAVYHLLSIRHNYRLRLRAYCLDDEAPVLPSVVDIWSSADWFEREAFDLYGILFDGHPDLRRILTDYGFIGHPFRKDFPLIGNVEVRYDPERGRVIYQPVTIEPRTLVPKVIREDSRYEPAIEEPPAGA
ncbi:MAG: NADH-quinone oxidoreductase subunit C [Gammaproteobacteria bacterium]|nr:NADH-quinone oxidoreductase subunit C [Gammaproteobacteria bacterium]